MQWVVAITGIFKGICKAVLLAGVLAVLIAHFLSCYYPVALAPLCALIWDSPISFFPSFHLWFGPAAVCYGSDFTLLGSFLAAYSVGCIPQHSSQLQLTELHARSTLGVKLCSD